MASVEEILNISPDKRKFTTNGSIDKIGYARYFFVETTTTNKDLYRKIVAGNYIMLHGPRAVGKSTRMLQACDNMSHQFNCMNVSLHDINIASPSEFWRSLSRCLVNKYSHISGIKVVAAGHEFNQMWHSVSGSKKFVLFIEFDALHSPATQETVDAVLGTFRGLKQSAADHHLHSVIVVGVFSIIRLNTRTVPPFNVGEQVVAPLMTLTQVQGIFSAYMRCREYTVADDVVHDIYERTGGHAGLVNLCGKAIDEEIRTRPGTDGNSLTLPTWLWTLSRRLETWLTDFPTVKRLVQDLVENDELRFSCRSALSDLFLCCHGAVPTESLDSPVPDFLMSVGMVREVEAGKLCLSNSMVRMLAIWQIVPMDRRVVISEPLPMTRDGCLDMFQLLLSSTC
jgi:hypothetical protein